MKLEPIEVPRMFDAKVEVYWPASHRASPDVRVILRLDDGTAFELLARLAYHGKAEGLPPMPFVYEPVA